VGEPMSPAGARARRRWLGRAVAALLATAVLVGGGTALTVTALQPAPPLAGAAVGTDLGVAAAPAEIDWPGSSAAGAFRVVGVDGAEGSFGAAGPMPIASIAKLVAALVVLERHPLGTDEQGPTITIGQGDVDDLRAVTREGASVLPVAVGQQLTQRQLLEASMLRSAANASTTLTTWAFGTTREYLGEARRWLEAHDLDGIRIVDATGLSVDNSAVAVDVARLMALVDGAPTLRAISGQRAAWLPGLGPVTSTNGALGAAGIDSGKTGSLNRSGRTVVVGASVEVGDRTFRIHAALLGIGRSADRDAAIVQLVESVARNLAEREVVGAGDVIATYDALWGERIELRSRTALRVIVWREHGATADLEIPDQLAVGARASVALTVTSSVEQELAWLDTVGAPRPPTLGWRLEHMREVLGWRFEEDRAGSRIGTSVS